MSTLTKLITNRFGGIRRKTSSFSDEGITCQDCQNVELFFTELNSGIGLRTVNGNTAVTVGQLGSCIPSTEEVVGAFESNQNGKEVIFVYTEVIAEHTGTSGAGKLYIYDGLQNTLTQLTTNAPLEKTNRACAVDFEQGTLDMFIFSNGKQLVYVATETDDQDEDYGITKVVPAADLNLVDSEGRTVRGLGLCVFGARLWIFEERRLWYSQQEECRDFNYTDSSHITSSGFIDFPKNITAICNYLGSVAVFHNDSSALVTEDETTLFKRSDESPGGCAGYNALVFHGTDLYFYDDTKKGVFSFQQIVNGDKTLGDNIAVDIQKELTEILPNETYKIRSLSVVTKDRNEVWFLVPVNVDDYEYNSSNQRVTVRRSLVLIYDYIRGEWVKRKCQHINGMAILGNDLFSYGKEIYKEYIGNSFDGSWIPSFYTCSVFTLGEDNTMKITKLPPRVTVDSSKKCKFWVTYVRNYTKAKKKEKFIQSKQPASNFKWGDGTKYGGVVGTTYIPATGSYLTKRSNAIVKLPSVTFKALEMSFETRDESQQFAIKELEMSKIKVKQV